VNGDPGDVVAGEFFLPGMEPSGPLVGGSSVEGVARYHPTAVLDLLRAAPLIDGHNDLLWELRQGRDPADPTLMTDPPRMAAGGVGGQFWSVYVPSDLPADRAVTMTFEQIDALLDIVRTNPDRLELARSADDVERIAAAGRVASMIGVEGGHAIGDRSRSRARPERGRRSRVPCRSSSTRRSTRRRPRPWTA
jgi:hypothetical protein